MTRPKMTRPKVYASVWDALADTPQQAENLRVRAEVMLQIAAIMKKTRWTQTRPRNGAESPSLE